MAERARAQDAPGATMRRILKRLFPRWFGEPAPRPSPGLPVVGAPPGGRPLPLAPAAGGPGEIQALLAAHAEWLESGGRAGARADLPGKSLRPFSFFMADLRRANLRRADLARCEVQWANLREADLEGANLAGADLFQSSLAGARLRGARLGGAGLMSADLLGADLAGADLKGADLKGARLGGADLRGADLRGADLTGAVGLTQDQLDQACGDGNTKLPPGLTIKPCEE